MSYAINLHCQRGNILCQEQEIVTKGYLERFRPIYLYIYIYRERENIDQMLNNFYDSDEFEIRVHFYRSSQNCEICLVVFALTIFVHGHR